MMFWRRLRSLTLSARQLPAPARRRAATLLELLVVTTIILLVTAISIRTVMPAIDSRQIREGARQLNVFINSARNRAMTTGRPMGVWIDRLAGLPEAAVSVSYAQVPDGYSGDYADSGAEGFLVADTSTNTTYGPRRYVNIIRAGSATSGGYDFWCAGQNGSYYPQRVVRPGDTVRLNYRNTPYRLFLDSSQGAAFWAVALGLNKNNYQDTNYLGDPWASPNGGYYYPINYFNDQGDRVQPFVTPGSSLTTYGKPVPYQILRQPIRSAAGSMQLPETVVIDLNFSGDDSKNFYPRNGPVYGIFTGVTGPDPYQGNAFYPTDTTPIIIMFSPSGSVEQVYCRYLQAPTTTGGQYQWIWRGDRQMTVINLLVGSRDNVPVTDTTSNWTTQLKYNWTMATNIWVAIQPRTGMVTAGEVIPPYQYIGASFQTMNQSAVVANLVHSYLQSDAASVSNARGFSSHGGQMSGQ